MTQIKANFKDSYGVPLVGFIRVKLDYLVTDNLTNESYLPIAHDIPLSNGQATLELEPSESARVTYQFEVYQRVIDTVPEPDTTTDYLVWSFRAKVPDSAEAIAITDLDTSTGITHDALDVSLSTIVRRLYLNQEFWDKLRVGILSIKGNYDPTLHYRRGDIVTSDGSSYLYINPTAVLNQTPPNPTYWQLLAGRGLPGVVAGGNTTPYNPTVWQGQTDAPSRSAVRDIVETLATKVSLDTKVSATDAALIRPVLASAVPSNTDRTSAIPSTAWVQTVLDLVRKAVNPVGAIQAFAGSSAPIGWLLCDGRTVSQASYQALFGILGTTYNTGGETTGLFRLPDLRGRVLVGLDFMSGLQGSANRVAQATLLGSVGGASTHALSPGELPAHVHGQVVSANANSGGTGIRIDFQGDSTGLSAFPQGVNTLSTGQNQPHNNLQPFMGLQYIIYTGT